MGKRIVVALGGNALGNTPEQQLELVKVTSKPIVDLVEKGYDVIIGHGNGPQVGMINLAMEFSANKGGNTPYMPFPECGAMTQGYIGYHLQQAIHPVHHAYRQIREPLPQILRSVLRPHRRQRRLKLPHLLFHQVYIHARRQRRHL